MSDDFNSCQKNIIFLNLALECDTTILESFFLNSPFGRTKFQVTEFVDAFWLDDCQFNWETFSDQTKDPRLGIILNTKPITTFNKIGLCIESTSCSCCHCLQNSNNYQMTIVLQKEVGFYVIIVLNWWRGDSAWLCSTLNEVCIFGDQSFGYNPMHQNYSPFLKKSQLIDRILKTEAEIVAKCKELFVSNDYQRRFKTKLAYNSESWIYDWYTSFGFTVERGDRIIKLLNRL